MMIVIVVGMAVPAILGENAVTSSAQAQRMQLEDAQTKTSIILNSLRAPALGNTVSFTLNNTGTTKLWNYQKFTVILSFEAGTGPAVESFSYQGITPSPSAGYWSISRFNNDIADPQILNQGESMNIICQLAKPLAASGPVTAVVSTDLGAQAATAGAIA